MGSYFRSFRWSLVGHLVILLGVSLLGLFRGWSCRRQPREQILPVEFLVDTTPLQPEPSEPEPSVPEPPPRVPEPSPVPERKPPPKAKRPPVKISTNLVRRSQSAPARKPSPPKAAGPRLTPEEVAKMLAAGAKPSDRTVLAGEDELALGLIKRTLHAAWIQPTAEQRGRRPAQVEIGLDRFGNVLRRRLLASSGNVPLDESAMRAVNAVQRISKLPEGFADRYPSVIIEFELE